MTMNIYTVQNYNKETAEITVDIFHHLGGRTIEWVQSLQIGETVALIGPGGGGVPVASSLLLCGDETSFPAIANILRRTAGTIDTYCILLCHSGAQDYPFPKPENTRFTWVEAGDFVKTTIEKHSQDSSSYLWCAAGRYQIEQIKSHEHFKSIPKGQKMAVQYWQKK